MYRLGTGRLPPTYVLAKQFADGVVETYIAEFLRANPTVSREDAESNRSISSAIAANISSAENFRKPAASVTEARHRLRMRYERIGKDKIQQLRKSRRSAARGTNYVEVDKMRERLAHYFAQDGERRDRGERDALYPEELESLKRKPDRQIMGIYFTYYNQDGTEKLREQRSGKRKDEHDDTSQPPLPFK